MLEAVDRRAPNNLKNWQWKVGGDVNRRRSTPVPHDHDGRNLVRRYVDERCFPECAIEQHSGLTPGVMVWGATSYHGRSNLLRIEGNLNSNRDVREVLQLEVVPFL
ncbi:uncharacterized protein TNCV_376711 [Trichonephila clavipes]|nr:uncharacterized protein TNCV_376711 [Trichonephila clavipes]